MRKWSNISAPINNEQVKPYYALIKKKWFYRFIKRLFDIFASLTLFFILLFPSIIIGLLVVLTSKGGMFFCQSRVGRYGKQFKIIKFRTMRKNSEGNQYITCNDDKRVTKIGKFLRKTHLDEFPQLINVFVGQMSFVGARPEVKQYVDVFKDEWYATLLMRPGVTSTASYEYEDESKILNESNVNEAYINVVLPQKMERNIDDLNHLNFARDIKILWKTVF